MTALAVFGVVLLIGGVAAAILSIDRYSNFMTRLRLVEPSLIESFAIEYTDGWNKKNAEIYRYFWNKTYLTSSDPSIRSLGESVRKTQLVALVAFGLGLIVSAIAK